MSTQHSGKSGSVYLIPSTLGDMAPLEVLPISIKQTIERLDHYIVENEKTARHFIKKISPRKSQPSLKLFLLNKFTEQQEIPTFLNPCLEGFDIGILSEAGCPGIADPGAAVVKIAHEKNLQVVPLVGPSSILLALMASGMNGQNFAFNGYLPIDGAERKKYIKTLERKSKEENQSQIFIETPYRNNKMLEELIKTLAPSTRICVAADITLPTEYIKTKTAINWKREHVDLHKRPAIFIIQA
ncbi:16S rRNA (cytidine1402-2'-O)-methyltransferase [Maribacter sedimenticola]|uniref:16S rRNA (Cytidine1402-2'-O)-methyltransferase n=1 Tax=Maribacter sedimenticola TaxID=228956 RepID=A0ABY1SG00_9FLAO|nr:SAM-dependent methyltransferase [Maribacter sedimenticola]SNR43821.1 16S rRNA (cytidine1402-2'-O)-methyltransferase [Maribacter sedimenticola]